MMNGSLILWIMNIKTKGAISLLLKKKIIYWFLSSDTCWCLWIDSVFSLTSLTPTPTTPPQKTKTHTNTTKKKDVQFWCLGWIFGELIAWVVCLKKLLLNIEFWAFLRVKKLFWSICSRIPVCRISFILRKCYQRNVKSKSISGWICCFLVLDDIF